MTKTIATREQIRDEVNRRLARLDGDCDCRVTLPTPLHNRHNACNWTLETFEGPKSCEPFVQKVIADVQREFDLLSEPHWR